MLATVSVTTVPAGTTVSGAGSDASTVPAATEPSGLRTTCTLNPAAVSVPVALATFEPTTFGTGTPAGAAAVVGAAVGDRVALVGAAVDDGVGLADADSVVLPAGAGPDDDRVAR